MFLARNSMLAAVALLALCASAQAGRVCRPYLAGSRTGHEVQLNDIHLEPGVPAYNYAVQQQPCGPNHVHVGTELTACDEGVAPNVSFQDVAHARISRPNPIGHGVVHGKIFCAPRHWAQNQGVGAGQGAGGSQGAPSVVVSARQ